jgi:putative transposase
MDSEMAPKSAVWADPKILGDVFRELARQRESQILQGYLCADHVHMHISIPPNYAVAQVFAFIKGKSAIHTARIPGGRAGNFVGEYFWARGYYVSTVDRDENVIRREIEKHEAEDKRLGQLNLLK